MTSQSIEIIIRLVLTVLSELVGHIVELDDLSGAHEGEVQWVGKEHNVFALVVLERDLLELVDVPGHTLEVRGGVLHAGLHGVVEGSRETGCLSHCEYEVVALLSDGSEVVLEQSELVKGLHLSVK